MNYYAFHIGDYAGATRHLSWDEDMAYRRMLDAYYSREAPLPLDRRHIYRLVVASEQRQREAVDAILEEFFEEREDGWYNHRAEEEIERASDKKEKARASAAMRWDRALHTDRNANASKESANAEPTHTEDMQTQCEGNAPNPNPNPNKERESARAREGESKHEKRVVEIIDSQPATEALDAWELEFLHSIRHKSRLTKSQTESLKAIEAKIAEKSAEKAQKAAQASVWVWAGTPQWDAWSAKRKWPTKDARHPEGGMRPGWFFPSEWPTAVTAGGKVDASSSHGADPPQKAA